MIMRVLAAVVASSVGFALAQGPVNGVVGANNATTPTEKDGNITIHYVTVGEATYNFKPNSINASPGDIVTFQFYPTNHSVIKAAYGYPCVPYEDLGFPGNTFYSGPMPVKEGLANPPSWNLTVNDTEPVFYYCGAPGSCINWGMVGVINANSSTSISTQIALAREADFQLLPGQPFPNEAQQASMASLAHTATTATLTVTATAAHESGEYSGGNGDSSGYDDGDDDDDDQSHGLSDGATAGIAVGAAVGALAVAGLFFLMWRTHHLKKALDQQQASTQAQSRPHPDMMSPAAFARQGTWPVDSRHTSSQLPPYQGYSQVGTDAPKPPDEDGLPNDRNRSPQPQQTPFNRSEQQFVPYHQLRNERSRYTSHSELTGYTPPVVELDAPRQDMSERESGRWG